MLDAVAAHPPPPELAQLEKPVRMVWPAIGSDSDAFLGLGVATKRWLDVGLRPLSEAEEAFDPTGPDLVHNDIWSGNIAISDDRCVLVDWAEAKRGSRFLDLGFLSLSLRSEGGRRSTPRFPGDAGYVAWWSAQLAVRLIDGPDSRLDPAIAEGFHLDLRTAVGWASELLGLPPPQA